MLLRSKVWVMVGLLCASTMARAEYKEVWNPPEAARTVRHSAHATKSASYSKPVPHAKAAAKSVASTKPKPGKAKVAANKPAPVHAKHVEAAAKPHPVAQNNTNQAASAQPPRELPPILH
ncbi:hypothetical protein [Paraburkholderia sp. C35]|uniref:hypothetical protein n=1 Tax=Paraburkholderia sp. C35 TaxID=2126993 RepID=UPI000D69CF50|nr:hypothetical protein [Paraburkholderia sp. C35]